MGIKNLFDKEAFSKALEDSPLSMQEIAEKVGCRITDLYRYKKAGESAPRINRLKKLVEILGPSITGLAVVKTDQQTTSFTPDERKYLSWFRSLPPYRQARILGYTSAIFEFGNEADGDFAADLAEKLIHAEQQQKEQPG